VARATARKGGIEMAAAMRTKKPQKGAEEVEKEAPGTEVQREMKGGHEMATLTRAMTPEREAGEVERPRHIVKAKEVLKGKEAVLAVLARAAEDDKFLARLADNPAEALEEYYTLTWEEKAALASGDLKRIESWVGKLDQRLAKWLWCRMSQEKW